jgi:hypothetical protein
MAAFGTVSYDSLPAMPSINALPGGVPHGPWGPLYRSAPGAQIPAVRYPGMMGAAHGRSGVTLLGGAAAGLGAPVQILGFGQGSKVDKVITIGVTALFAGAYGAGLAWTIKSRRPIRNAALFTGGMASVGGLLALAASNGNGA